MAESDLLLKVNDAREAAMSAAKAAATYEDWHREFLRVEKLRENIIDMIEEMKVEAAIARPPVHVQIWPQIPAEPDPARSAGKS
jgi:urease gamma subunit